MRQRIDRMPLCTHCELLQHTSAYVSIREQDMRQRIDRMHHRTHCSSCSSALVSVPIKAICKDICETSGLQQASETTASLQRACASYIYIYMYVYGHV